MNTEESAQNQLFSLEQQATQQLLVEAKTYYQSNVYPILLAPLYRLMADWTQKTNVVISHRSHGRDLGDGMTFLDSMGNFAVNFPVGVNLEGLSMWEDLIQEITEQFEALPMNGITYDWIGDRLPEYLYPDSNLTQVRANYLGNRSVPPSDLFGFVYGERDCRLSPPQQKRTTLLEFFFLVIDGCLEVRIEYSRNFYEAQTIQNLGEEYLGLLSQILSSTKTTVQG